MSLIEREVAAHTEDEMCPKLFLFSEELAEALEELAVFDGTMTTPTLLLLLLGLPLGLLLWLLTGAVMDGAVEVGYALLEDGDEGVGSLHPESVLDIFGFGFIGM